MFQLLSDALGDFSERLGRHLLYVLQCMLLIGLLSMYATITSKFASNYLIQRAELMESKEYLQSEVLQSGFKDAGLRSHYPEEIQILFEDLAPYHLKSVVSSFYYKNGEEAGTVYYVLGQSSFFSSEGEVEGMNGYALSAKKGHWILDPVGRFELTEVKALPKNYTQVSARLSQIGENDLVVELSYEDFLKLDVDFSLIELLDYTELQFPSEAERLQFLRKYGRGREDFYLRFISSEKKLQNARDFFVSFSLSFLFIFIMVTFLLLGLIVSFLQMIDQKRREYAIHLLVGGTVGKLYFRFLIQILLILLPANLREFYLYQQYGGAFNFFPALLAIDVLVIGLTLVALSRDLKQSKLLEGVKDV